MRGYLRTKLLRVPLVMRWKKKVLSRFLSHSRVIHIIRASHLYPYTNIHSKDIPDENFRITDFVVFVQFVEEVKV